MTSFAVREREGRPAKKLRRMREVFARRLRIAYSQHTKLSFPCFQYADDPEGFCRDVLGIEQLWDKQLELIHAVAIYDRVSVRATQKSSKSFTLAALALWWWSTRKEGRVIFLAPTYRQCQAVLYRQILQLIRQSKAIHPDAWEGTRIAMLADNGIQSEDFRSINGFVSHDTGGLQGLSGQNLLFIIDEASHVSEDIYNSCEGNSAGGARIVALSNPLLSFGWYFNTFHRNREFWHNIHISCYDSPNYKAQRVVIPGLVTYDMVKRREKEWGLESYLFKTRMAGEFALSDESKMFPHERVSRSIELQQFASGDGKLCIGLDPAGAGERGDETAVCCVRNKRMLRLEVQRGLTEENIVEWVQRTVRELRAPEEKPEVRVDSEGQIGARVLGLLLNAQKTGDFIVVNVRSNEAAQEKQTFGAVRDELAAHAEKWLKEGGAILNDAKLQEELAVMTWYADAKGRQKLISKKEIGKIIYRSPDRFDSMCLAVYQTTVGSSRESLQRQLEARAAEQSQRAGSPDRAWRERGEKNNSGGRRALYGR